MNILEELSKVNWQAAIKTYGNAHASLIGLLVAWWNNISEHHWTLEAAPSWGGRDTGYCDAILCANNGPRIIVEVEGTNYVAKLDTIQNYFQAEHMESLYAGILLSYAYRVQNREYVKPPTQELFVRSINITQENPDKELILITAYKHYESIVPEIRRREHDYYCGRICKIESLRVVNGDLMGRRIYYEE